MRVCVRMCVRECVCVCACIFCQWWFTFGRDAILPASPAKPEAACVCTTTNNNLAIITKQKNKRKKNNFVPYDACPYFFYQVTQYSRITLDLRDSIFSPSPLFAEKNIFRHRYFFKIWLIWKGGGKGKRVSGRSKKTTTTWTAKFCSRAAWQVFLNVYTSKLMCVCACVCVRVCVCTLQPIRGAAWFSIVWSGIESSSSSASHDRQSRYVKP